MCEKIFAILFRFYPAGFRARYGDEALQLIRDRLRDEKGALSRMRLCFDLLKDLATGLPLAYLHAESSAAALPQTADGIPHFGSLAFEPLRPRSFVLGSVVSMTMLCALGFALAHGPRYLPGADGGKMTPIEAAIARINRPMPPGSADVASQSAGAVPASRDSTVTQVASLPMPLPADEQRRVVSRVAAALRERYFDRQASQRASDSIEQHEQRGDYDAFSDGRTFAAHLTADIRYATGDMHLIVVHSDIPLPTMLEIRSTVSEQDRASLLAQDCTIRNAEILPHRIGYLRLDSFPDPGLCGPRVASALAKMNGTDALVIDLRANGGGIPEMVALVASSLIDRSVPWYNPRNGNAMTLSPMKGSRLAEEPVFVLTSSRTNSAAEQFSYNLKMLHRAVIVGEKTAGNVHVGAFHPVDEHFGVGIPEQRIVNPYGVSDWEGQGVYPDVRVEASGALQTAETLAQKAIAERSAAAKQ